MLDKTRRGGEGGEKRRENLELVAAAAAAYVRGINYIWPEQRRLILSLCRRGK